jgi:hypothetical protein
VERILYYPLIVVICWLGSTLINVGGLLGLQLLPIDADNAFTIIFKYVFPTMQGFLSGVAFLWTSRDIAALSFHDLMSISTAAPSAFISRLKLEEINQSTSQMNREPVKDSPASVGASSMTRNTEHRASILTHQPSMGMEDSIESGSFELTGGWDEFRSTGHIEPVSFSEEPRESESNLVPQTPCGKRKQRRENVV